MMTVDCAGCHRPILDRFLMNFLDKTWHSSCVKCQICRKLLDQKCFFKEGNIYCREDFYRCFGTKCSGCGEGILPQDYVRKAREKVYHIRCFACSVCQKELATGETLYLGYNDETLMCKEDYLKNQQDSLFSDEDEELDDRIPIPGLDSHPHHALPPHPLHHPMNHHPHDPTSIIPGSLNPTTQQVKLETNNNNDKADFGDKDADGDSLDGDGRDCKGEDAENKSPDADGGAGKRRGPRTTIKAKQLEVLKTAFSQTPKPTRHIREQLAKDTGLSMRVIQVWFQNKRSKERRMKQMTSGMMSGRAFFPGKGGRRGFPMIGEDFGYFPHDKGYHPDFGYPPNFPPPDGFFPGGPMGFMGPNMDQPLPMNGPPMPPPGMGVPNGPPPEGGFPPTSMGGSGPGSDSFLGDGASSEGNGPNSNSSGNNGNTVPPERPSPGEGDFPNNSSNGSNGPGFSSSSSDQNNEQMVW